MYVCLLKLSLGLPSAVSELPGGRGLGGGWGWVGAGRVGGVCGSTAIYNIYCRQENVWLQFVPNMSTDIIIRRMS